MDILKIKIRGCDAFQLTMKQPKCSKKDFDLIQLLETKVQKIPIFVSMINELKNRINASRTWFGFGSDQCDV
jgi:hypothetical protein